MAERGRKATARASARVGRRKKLGPLGCGVFGGRGRFLQKHLTFRLGECRKRSRGRESDENKSERREEGTAAAHGDIQPVLLASDAPKRSSREKGHGPGGDGDPERKVGEREQRDGEEGREEGVDRTGRGRWRALAPGDESHDEREGRNRTGERGGQACLGPESDGFAVRVVEVGRAASVHEMTSRALLGREPRGNEAVRERAGAGSEKRPRADHLAPREESDVALGRGGREVAAAELLELQEEAMPGSGRDREKSRDDESRESESAPADVERDECRDASAERERRRDGLGCDETEEGRQKTERREASRPGGCSRLRRPREEEQRGNDESHPDVARVSDEARRQKTGLRDFEGQPEDAGPALERREGTGGGPRRHQRNRRGGRGARARLGCADEEERERGEDGGGRERVHDIRVRDGRQDCESERREEAEGGDACGELSSERRKRSGPREADHRERRPKRLDEELRLAKRVAGGCGEEEKGERESRESPDEDERRSVRPRVDRLLRRRFRRSCPSDAPCAARIADRSAPVLPPRGQHLQEQAAVGAPGDLVGGEERNSARRDESARAGPFAAGCRLREGEGDFSLKVNRETR